MLAELTAEEHAQTPGVLVAALTDGPLEPFVREPQKRKDLAGLYNDYLSALRGIANPMTATAGYVDKPRSDLLVRLLELVVLEQGGRLERAGHERSLPGVTGCRSAAGSAAARRAFGHLRASITHGTELHRRDRDPFLLSERGA